MRSSGRLNNGEGGVRYAASGFWWINLRNMPSLEAAEVEIRAKVLSRRRKRRGARGGVSGSAREGVGESARGGFRGGSSGGAGGGVSGGTIKGGIRVTPSPVPYPGGQAPVFIDPYEDVDIRITWPSCFR